MLEWTRRFWQIDYQVFFLHSVQKKETGISTTHRCQRSLKVNCLVQDEPGAPSLPWDPAAAAQIKNRPAQTIFCRYGFRVIRVVLYLKSPGRWSWMTHWHISSYRGQAALLQRWGASHAQQASRRVNGVSHLPNSWWHIVGTSVHWGGKSEIHVSMSHWRWYLLSI